MEILCQRGKDTFLVKSDLKYYVINTLEKTMYEISSPDILYRQGYCEKPHASKVQILIIKEVLSK